MKLFEFYGSIACNLSCESVAVSALPTASRINKHKRYYDQKQGYPKEAKNRSQWGLERTIHNEKNSETSKRSWRKLRNDVEWWSSFSACRSLSNLVAAHSSSPLRLLLPFLRYFTVLPYRHRSALRTSFPPNKFHSTTNTDCAGRHSHIFALIFSCVGPAVSRRGQISFPLFVETVLLTAHHTTELDTCV